MVEEGFNWTARRFLKPLLLTGALLAVVFALAALTNASEAKAANGTCENGICQWNCNPQAATSWCWFDAVGGNNARNWFYDDGIDHYASHVWKCASAIRADNGSTWASTCNNNELTWQSYVRCNCGGLYVRTWNNANEPRNINSTADS